MDPDLTAKHAATCAYLSLLRCDKPERNWPEYQSALVALRDLKARLSSRDPEIVQNVYERIAHEDNWISTETRH